MPCTAKMRYSMEAPGRGCRGVRPRRTAPDQRRAIGSAGERLVHTEEVTGSIPVSPTRSGPYADLSKGHRGSHSCSGTHDFFGEDPAGLFHGASWSSCLELKCAYRPLVLIPVAACRARGEASPVG